MQREKKRDPEWSQGISMLQVGLGEEKSRDDEEMEQEKLKEPEEKWRSLADMVTKKEMILG